MPNWCYNEMTVSGEAEELERFIDMIAIPESELPEPDKWDGSQIKHSLIRLMPMPLALEGTTSPTPDTPDPHPNWANLLAKGEITQEWHDELCQRQVESYEAGVRSKEQTGYANWYEWQHANWGIKWGDCRTHVDDNYAKGDTSVIINYETPWAPFGDNFMEVVSRTFPNLTFIIEMTEEANFFAGADRWVNGVHATVDVNIDHIVDSVPEVDEDDSDAEYARWHEINERIRDAVECAAMELIN